MSLIDLLYIMIFRQVSQNMIKFMKHDTKERPLMKLRTQNGGQTLEKLVFTFSLFTRFSYKK